MLRANSKFNKPFWLGVWYVVPVTRQMISESAEVVLDKETMAVLCMLAKHGGEVVSLDNLIATVWPSLDVDYNVLADTIIKLREQLGDDPKDPQYIETVPQKGYRLRARVYYRDPPVKQSTAQSFAESFTQSSEKVQPQVPPIVNDMYSSRKSANQRLYTNLFGGGNPEVPATHNQRYAYYLLGIISLISISLVAIFNKPDVTPLPEQVNMTNPAANRLSNRHAPLPLTDSSGKLVAGTTVPSMSGTSSENSDIIKAKATANKKFIAENEPTLSNSASSQAGTDAGEFNRNDFPSSLPTKKYPVLIVLPFANLSGEMRQQYFSEGFSETLSDTLSRVSGLRVIAYRNPNQSMHQTANLNTLARQFSADYMLQGDVRRERDQLQIKVKLIEITSGNVVWSESYNRNIKEIFDVQDSIRNQLFTALSMQVANEKDNLIQTTSIDAYDLYLQARFLLRHGKSALENNKARELIEKAIVLDPRFAQAQIALSAIYTDNFRYGWSDTATSAKRAIHAAETAMRLEPNSPQANWALGYVSLYVQGDHERAIELSERMIDLAPDNPAGYALLSDVHAFAGSPEKARMLLESLKQDKQEYHSQAPSTLGLANLLLGNYQASLKSLEESLSMDSGYVQGNVYKLIALYRMGDVDDAHKQARQLFTLYPEFDAKAWASRLPFKDDQVREAMVNDLDKIIRL